MADATVLPAILLFRHLTSVSVVSSLAVTHQEGQWQCGDAVTCSRPAGPDYKASTTVTMFKKPAKAAAAAALIAGSLPAHS